MTQFEKEIFEWFFNLVGYFNHYGFFVNKEWKKIEGFEKHDEAEIKCLFMHYWFHHKFHYFTKPVGMAWFTNDTIYFYLNKDNKEMNGNIETNQCKVNGLKRGDEYPIMEGVECNECIKYYFPDGYEFVDTDDTGVYLKPIKPKYPKTYEECCKINEDVADASLTCFACNLLNDFQKLLLCRDAYWEIAGEQMGLDELWEPDWNDPSKGKHCIFWDLGEITCDELHRRKVLLAFPTEEMRDAFYENFKDLIEQCKELL